VHCVTSYTCIGATNCNSTTYTTRGEVIGCLYFCDYDTNDDDGITRAEFDDPFNACDAADFVGTYTGLYIAKVSDCLQDRLVVTDDVYLIKAT